MLFRSIQKELDAEKPEGEEALQKLFKDIYSKADSATQRAMNKVCVCVCVCVSVSVCGGGGGGGAYMCVCVCVCV